MDDRYGTLRAPVMLVGGLAATADSFEVLTGMALGLQKEGPAAPGDLQAAPWGSSSGFTASIIFSTVGMGQKRIELLGLNTFLQDLERRYLPDLILMEAPDPVMRYNNIAPNGFGIRTYMLCQAAPPDYLLCCVPCDLAVGNFLEMLSDDFSHRLGAAISGVCVSNFIVDSANLLQTREVSYARTGMEMVYAQIEREGPCSKIPMFYAAAAGDGAAFVPPAAGGNMKAHMGRRESYDFDKRNHTARRVGDPARQAPLSGGASGRGELG